MHGAGTAATAAARTQAAPAVPSPFSVPAPDPVFISSFAAGPPAARLQLARAPTTAAAAAAAMGGMSPSPMRGRLDLEPKERRGKPSRELREARSGRNARSPTASQQHRASAVRAVPLSEAEPPPNAREMRPNYVRGASAERRLQSAGGEARPAAYAGEPLRASVRGALRAHSPTNPRDAGADARYALRAAQHLEHRAPPPKPRPPSPADAGTSLAASQGKGAGAFQGARWHSISP
ncbi:hypothetical protein T492DRAFT_875662 [Pavlovales sp. CCMP2436]|nr:hypothetical protein T492DRAFT_875662 [Pavlovales sp. CCMP2436]